MSLNASEQRGFVKEPEFQVSPRRKLVRGDACRISGVRGRFRFMYFVHPNDGRRSPWVDVIEVDSKGQPKRGGVRSFDAQRVRKA